MSDCTSGLHLRLKSECEPTCCEVGKIFPLSHGTYRTHSVVSFGKVSWSTISFPGSAVRFNHSQISTDCVRDLDKSHKLDSIWRNTNLEPISVVASKIRNGPLVSDSFSVGSTRNPAAGNCIQSVHRISLSSNHDNFSQNLMSIEFLKHTIHHSNPVYCEPELSKSFDGEDTVLDSQPRWLDPVSNVSHQAMQIFLAFRKVGHFISSLE